MSEEQPDSRGARGTPGRVALPGGGGVRPRVTRRERTQANDRAILDAAVERIRIGGLDRLSMREVADSAGLTSGATYARYENATELAIDVWTRRCQEPLMELVAHALSLLFRPDPAMADSVARRLIDPSPELRAAIEILAVSRRIDEFAEIVEQLRPDVVRAFEPVWDAAPVDERGRAIRLGGAAQVLGGLLYAIVPGMTPIDWPTLLRWFVHSAAVEVELPLGAPRRIALPALRASTGDPIRDRVVEAVGRSVARSGVERTTISRIARRADCGIAAIYDRYPTRSELVVDAVDILLAELDQTSLMHYPDLALGAFDAAADVLASTVASVNAERRRLRLEIHIAAAHDPEVARALVAAEERLRDEAVARFRSSGNAAEAGGARAWVDVARVASRGMGLLVEILPDIEEVDWRWLTQSGLRTAYRGLTGEDRPREGAAAR